MRFIISLTIACLILVILFGDVSVANRAAEYRSKFLNVDLIWQTSYWHFGVWTPRDVPLQFQAGVAYD